MTANDSSSSVANATDLLRVDLAAEGLVAPLPRAYLNGTDRDLLAPLRFLEPGTLPPQADAADPAGSSGPAPSQRDRGDIAAALRRANRSYGHPGADRLADRLADPATRVVVAGQQPGLFGGPLYTLSKMVAAGRWAAEMEAAGTPSVAVFWIATEDHDWHEVARTAFLVPDGLRRFELGDDPDPLLPVGMRTLGPGVGPILDSLRELRTSDRFETWLDDLASIYRPDARFGEAFGRLAVALLGERCPLLLDSMDPGVKAAEAPWLERFVERRAAWEEASEAADRAIAARGYGLQVSPQRGVSPLFALRGGERRRIEWQADGPLGGESDRYLLRGAADPEPGSESGPLARPLDDLRATLGENPGAISPGVLARPAIQDAILGTTLMVLGPGEMSYMAQAAPAYGVLGIEAPWVALRPQVLVLEEHHRAKLEELELPLAALLGTETELERLLAGDGGSALVEAARERVEAALDALGESALALDRNLERPLEKTRQTMVRALETFGGKVTSAAARSDQVKAGRVERLRQICLPEGTLQERVVSSSHWPGKYGERFIDALWDQMELDGRHLQVVQP